MKIIDVKTYSAAANWRTYIFIELVTDEGIIGTGEATLANNTNAVIGAIQDLRRYFIGKDPFDIEKIWRGMHRGPFWRGGAIFTTAISAVDQALWDIVGKTLKTSLYRLIGGRYHDSIRVYANGWFSGTGTPIQFARAAKRTVRQGFDALKFDPFGTSDMTLDQKTEKNAIDIVGAVREAVGPKVDLLIEGHGRFTPRVATRIGKKLEHFDPFWFEEPVSPEDIDGLVNVSKAINVPIASGERLFTRLDYWNLIEKRAADIIQPDICHVGGVSEIRKVAAMAEAKNILIAPHNSNGAVSTAASAHFLTSTPNALILEYWVDVPWRSRLVFGSESISNGRIKVADRPGLGVELNHAEISRHPPKESHINFFEKYKYH